jgi:hypothetical protein
MHIISVCNDPHKNFNVALSHGIPESLDCNRLLTNELCICPTKGPTTTSASEMWSQDLKETVGPKGRSCGSNSIGILSEDGAS